MSCKLSPIKTICRKCYIVFSGKTLEKYLKLPSPEIFTQHAKCEKKLMRSNMLGKNLSRCILTFFIPFPENSLISCKLSP